MYIPSIFLGAQGACINSTGGNLTGSYVSGSQVYKFHLFTTAGTSSLNIISGSTRQAHTYIIGGGGGGAYGINTTPIGAAGGGAGGGFVRYTQFPLQSGSYQIVVGQSGSKGNSTNYTGSNGNDSWIKLPVGTWPPFTDQYIRAYGGGGGGWQSSNLYPPGVGGNAGGNTIGYNTATIDSGSNIGDGYGGLGGLNQGYKSTWLPSSVGATNNANVAGGGSGAGGASTLPNVSTGHYGGDGGPGVQISISSSLIYVAGGGAGWGTHPYLGTAGTGSTSYGGGGNGNQTTTATNGKSGMVYVEYPICVTDLTHCTTYTASAGASIGATITYVPCGGGTLVTASIGPNSSASFCTFPVSGYPTISGAGSSLTAGVGCDVNVAFTGSTVCPSGSFISSSYTYTFTNSTATQGSPAIRVTGYVNYYDNDGVFQEFYNYYYNPSTRTFCARPYPAPYVSNGTISQGGVCASYCTGVNAPCYNWTYKWLTNNNDVVTYQDCTGSVHQFSGAGLSGSFCAQGTPFCGQGFVTFTKGGTC